jgi:hypothetical protein
VTVLLKHTVFGAFVWFSYVKAEAAFRYVQRPYQMAFPHNFSSEAFQTALLKKGDVIIYTLMDEIENIMRVFTRKSALARMWPYCLVVSNTSSPPIMNQETKA